MEVEEVKKFLETFSQDSICFDAHFYKRTVERPITEGMVRNFLSKLSKLEKIEKGRGDRFKLWFKMSRKYSLVLIIELSSSKGLKVISAWNTNIKWQNKLRK